MMSMDAGTVSCPRYEQVICTMPPRSLTCKSAKTTTSTQAMVAGETRLLAVLAARSRKGARFCPSPFSLRETKATPAVKTARLKGML